MELSQMKKLIEKSMVKHTQFILKCREAEKYYKNENDILISKSPGNTAENESDPNPLRNADNRIPHNFHGLLVNQKAAYMFTYPPSFDVGNDEDNKLIADTLGDDFTKECIDLCVDAANCSRAWLHVWKDEEKGFQYSNVDPKEVIPIYSGSLKKELMAVIRVYIMIDDEDAQEYDIYEYWDNEKCIVYRKKREDSVQELTEYNMFAEINIIDNLEEEELSNIYEHDFGVVPFIEFPNNNISTNDLKNIKKLIDIYDKIDSGFVNDLEDIQEIVFVLTNYGGTDLKEFLHGLKKYKTVDMQNSGADDKSGLSTLTIDIPIEAREKLLDRTRKLIFELGQGIDPNPENFGNSSGVALEYLYSLLELKSGFTEAQFRPGFNKLVRIVCGDKKVGRIVQTWTRNKIRNDKETAEIAKMSQGVISDRTIMKNHPWIDDIELEEKQKLEDEAKMYNTKNPYDNKNLGVDNE